MIKNLTLKKERTSGNADQYHRHAQNEREPQVHLQQSGTE
jgi:hypothetical protein